MKLNFHALMITELLEPHLKIPKYNVINVPDIFCIRYWL